MTSARKTYLQPLLVILVLTLAVTVAVIFLPRLAGRELLSFWETPYFHLGNVSVTPEVIIETIVFLVLLTAFTRLTRRFVRFEVLSHTAMDEGQRYAIERTLGYAVFAMGLFMGMQILGLNLSSLAFLGGAVGIGVGFGLQNIASNFASGIILLLERPIKVGDRIEVGSLNGDVVRIGGRSTWVRTNDNVIIIVPNADFTTNRVTNWTANDRQVRFSFPVGVAYGSDLEQVKTLLLAIAAHHADVLEEPPPEVLLTSFEDSSINLNLRVCTINQVKTPARLKSDLYFEIVKQFAANHIEIPFPQRDVYIKTLPPLAAETSGALGATASIKWWQNRRYLLSSTRNEPTFENAESSSFELGEYT